MSDPIKLPHPLPGTRVRFQKKATFKIEATVDVMWPEGVPFDEDKAASIAGNSLIVRREVSPANVGIKWALVESSIVNIALIDVKKIEKVKA